MPLTPRDYQLGAINAPFEYWKTHKGNPLIQAPTGAGKSLIIAEFVKECSQYPNTRILCLAHVKELLEQNEAEMLGQWPEADVGVYSAGLKRRELRNAITIAGIQSIYKKARILGKVDLVIIDEAHLVPQKAMGRYRKLLHELQEINPNLKVVGYTATPWRLQGGCLTEGAESIFNKVVYEISLTKLIQEGHLCNVKALDTHGTADFSNLQIASNGDFTEASILEAIQANNNTNVAIEESLELGKDCKSWLVFCAGVDHAKEVCEKLNDSGISSKVLVGETDKRTRKEMIDDFKERKFRALVSVSCITTGFNAKNADFMLCLRPTQSSSLWVQMVGRVMRTHPDKARALIADYGENIERHGPIEQIKPPKPAKTRGPQKKTCPKCDKKASMATKKCKHCGHAYTRPCPNCHKQLLMDAIGCDSCGYTFIQQRITALTDRARGGEVISSELDPPKWVEVDDVVYKRHVKKDGTDSVRANFVCKGIVYSHWICVEHQGYARDIARRYYARAGVDMPATVEDALKVKVCPKQIQVVKEGKWNRVRDFLW